MKNLFLSALLIVGMTTYAQDYKKNNAQQLTSQQKVDMQVQRLTKELKLDEKQIPQVNALLTKEVEKREAMKAERESMINKMKEEEASFKGEMKKILTADQYTKWESKFEERKSKMKDIMHEKHGNKDFHQDK